MEVDVRLRRRRDMSAMLWNGVRRIPRFSAKSACSARARSPTAACASAPFRGRSGPKRYSARQPSCVTCHGRPASAIPPRRRRPTPGERDHALERVLGEHLGERRSHRRERERVRRERPADAADVDVLELDRPRQASGDLVREPVRRGRDAARDRLADRHDVRLESVRLRVAARAAADRVRLVDREQRAVPCG